MFVHHNSLVHIDEINRSYQVNGYSSTNYTTTGVQYYPSANVPHGVPSRPVGNFPPKQKSSLLRRMHNRFMNQGSDQRRR